MRLRRHETVIGATLLCLTLSFALACNSNITSTDPTAGSGASSAGGEGFGGEESWIVKTGSGGCDTVLYDPPDLKSTHTDDCTKLDLKTNPPNTGPHYGSWATFKTYDDPVPWGYLIHAMEHGAVVLAYNCSGCDKDIQDMQDLIDAQPQDDACSDPIKNRYILAPAPDLDVPFAVAAWGHMLKAQCFDEKLVSAFVKEHYDGAPEKVCAAGIDPSDPDAMIPKDCGK